MAVATGLAIAAGVSAAVNMWGAHKAAQASKKAAEQQTAAADKGLAMERQMYDRTQANLAPFQAAGNGATASLAAKFQTPYLGNNGVNATGQQVKSGTVPMSAFASPLPNQPGTAQPRPTTQVNPGGAPNRQPTPQAMVTLKGPDGATRQFQSSDPNFLALSKRPGFEVVQ
jgi:hypothetical protein